MNVNAVYSWEIETIDGTIYKQYNEDGSENSSKKIDPDLVVRISYIPKVALFPQHDVIVNLNIGDRFIRRFGRGFIKQVEDFKLVEYLHCIVTNRYRLYIFSSCGKCLVTDKDYEVYI